MVPAAVPVARIADLAVPALVDLEAPIAGLAGPAPAATVLAVQAVLAVPIALPVCPPQVPLIPTARRVPAVALM